MSNLERDVCTTTVCVLNCSVLLLHIRLRFTNLKVWLGKLGPDHRALHGLINVCHACSSS